MNEGYAVGRATRLPLAFAGVVDTEGAIGEGGALAGASGIEDLAAGGVSKFFWHVDSFHLAFLCKNYLQGPFLQVRGFKVS